MWENSENKQNLKQKLEIVQVIQNFVLIPTFT